MRKHALEKGGPFVAFAQPGFFHTGAARALPQSARSIARLVWPRWDKDHKLAMAAAIVAANAVVK